jgi:hypothetical protein
MSDNFRYRKEFNKPRYYAVDSATVIEIGDMLWLDTDDVKPASDYTWDTNIATTQRAFAKVFVGVAADRSASGDTDLLQVNMAGVHEFACASAAHELEDYVAPANSGSSTLVNQTVVKVTDPTLAIAKVAQREASATTTVKVEVIGGAIPGSYNTPEEIITALESVASGSELSADAVQDGTTNHVFTSADDTKLTGIEASADVTDATNVSAAGALMLTDMNASKFFIGTYTADGDDDTAGYMEIDTGFGSAPTWWMTTVMRSGVPIASDQITSAQASGAVRVADGGATYAVTTGDVLMVIAGLVVA